MWSHRLYRNKCRKTDATNTGPKPNVEPPAPQGLSVGTEHAEKTPSKEATVIAAAAKQDANDGKGNQDVNSEAKCLGCGLVVGSAECMFCEKTPSRAYASTAVKAENADREGKPSPNRKWKKEYHRGLSQERLWTFTRKE